jgi:acetylornithine/succinyldiaminopimelate/putrescine aminotransferase
MRAAVVFREDRPMDYMLKLQTLRSCGGGRRTTGLDDDTIRRFAERDPSLVHAIADAADAATHVRAEFPGMLDADEAEQIQLLQAGLVNFYADDQVNPYVALGASGPWVVTSKGAVVHDNGGYGMLGFGHAPEKVIATMAGRQVMANVMTASFSQLRFVQSMRREVGHRRGACPYERFVCLNSGSEAMTLAARLADVNAKLQTEPGARYAGKPIRGAAIQRGFHGRTERPAQYSDSTRKAYVHHLASFRERAPVLTAAPNDVAGLRELYARAEREGVFVEALFVEPVMGEGNPGLSITREFYDAARALTRAHGSLFVIDSIQAGLRAQGCLSIVDYPGFEGCEAPDIESYSKALNAGQYPLSVLALGELAASLYRKGVYGNTMTTNPRALDVACTVLESVTPALRSNIRERGAELVRKFRALADELDGRITGVQGTGLLASVELDPTYKCYGAGSTEEYMRTHGLGVIHGGDNSLRFTPHFAITSEEIDLVVAATRDALLNGPHADRFEMEEEEEEQAIGI